MNFQEIQALDRGVVMPTYGRFAVALDHGKGAVATDTQGKEYIDFGSGIGVNSLGFAYPAWVKAVSEQAATLQHTSNLYYNPVQAQFADELCRAAGTNARSSWPASTASTITEKAARPSSRWSIPSTAAR